MRKEERAWMKENLRDKDGMTRTEERRVEKARSEKGQRRAGPKGDEG